MYFAELISFGCSSASFISQPTHRLSSLPQAVPLLGLHTSTTAPRARRPLGPLTPPVCSDICTLLQAVGGLRQVLSYHKGHIAHDKKGQGSPQPGPHTDRDAAPPPPEHLHPTEQPRRAEQDPMQPYGRTPTTSDRKGLIQRWYLIKGNVNMAQVPIPSQLLPANPHLCTGS